MNNPFTISFGKAPLQYISRFAQTNEIEENFSAEIPSNQIYMITGVRGAGKTVMMTTIAGKFAGNDDWIVVELNPARDILNGLAGKLYGIPEMHKLFLKAKLDFSAFGLGVSIEGATPTTDIEAALELMLEHIKKSGKRLLITIDEAVNNENVKVFASSFQIFMRHEYPIFLLMTGVYENIYNLQNDKSLTFLYRAPKIVLEPLNITAIKHSYMKVFDISEEEAERMARLTKGYSFAFQVLGYLYWKNAKRQIDLILPEYDQYLDEYVYSKIWSELSEGDKKVLYEISISGETQVKMLREKLSMSSEAFSVYRDRLKRKGIINTEHYGHVSLIKCSPCQGHF